jgi:hypothetical protein
MSAFERLLAIASGTGEVLSLAREIIGKEKLAVLLAKSALIDTNETLSATKVGLVLAAALIPGIESVQLGVLNQEQSLLGAGKSAKGNANDLQAIEFTA